MKSLETSKWILPVAPDILHSPSSCPCGYTRWIPTNFIFHIQFIENEQDPYMAAAVVMLLQHDQGSKAIHSSALYNPGVVKERDAE